MVLIKVIHNWYCVLFIAFSLGLVTLYFFSKGSSEKWRKTIQNSLKGESFAWGYSSLDAFPHMSSLSSSAAFRGPSEWGQHSPVVCQTLPLIWFVCMFCLQGAAGG